MSPSPWLSDRTVGLFLHWGLGTWPGHTDVHEWEAAVAAGRWTPTYWVEEAVRLHAGYIVLAMFHSRLGYARPWPSAVPGSPRTGRDYLGELIEAAGARDVRIMLYVTDDPQWHESRWLSSEAYSAFVGRPVDLTTPAGFGEFAQAVVLEAADRYPDLGGFWIDRDNPYWRAHGLYDRLRKLRPDVVLSNNSVDDPAFDVASFKEVPGVDPPYDYPQGISAPPTRLAEADFSVAGSWWYDGEPSTVDVGLTLKRLVANAGSGVRTLLAETAQLDGRFPPSQAAFNAFAERYLAAIWPSLHGVRPGGYPDGLPPGRWNDGAYGVTTIDRADADRHYVHVLDPPPSGSVLRLRDNGYAVVDVSDLRTGATLAFKQSGGHVMVDGVEDWDPYDTVLLIRTAGRTGLLTGAFAGGVLDLGAVRPFVYIGLSQPEDTACVPVERSARIRSYTVSVGEDGHRWTTAARGELPNARGAAFIDVPGGPARYIRLEVISGWGGPARVLDLWAAGLPVG